MDSITMALPDPEFLGPVFFLLAAGIFAVLLLLTLRFFIFCRECKKTAKRLEGYVYYILEEEDADPEQSMGQAGGSLEEQNKPKPMTKGQQEALLQEILGGFLS
jgi:hypothetical protein